MRRYGRVGLVLSTVVLAAAVVVGLVIASGSRNPQSGPASAHAGASSSSVRPAAPVARASSLPTITLDSGGSPSSTWTGREPTMIGFSGDAGDVVTGITWTVWSPTEAVGHGIWGHDDCVPNCAEGTTTDYPATLRLSHPVDGGFRTLVEKTQGPDGFVMSFEDPSPSGWRPWTTMPSTRSSGRRM